MQSNTATDLFKEICEHPDEHDRKLVYADWLEESGELDRAAAWRWIGERGRNPVSVKSGNLIGWIGDHPEQRDSLCDDLLSAITYTWLNESVNITSECYTALESALIEYKKQHGRMPE